MEIRILGSKRYSDSEIIRVTELKVGAQVTPKAFQQAANRLAATGAFADVNYHFSTKAGGVAVEFRVSDSRDFGTCNFDNFVWFDEKDLRGKLREMVPLFGEEVPLKGNIPEKIQAAITQVLKARGIPGTVSYTAAGELGGTVRALQFRVSGARLVIREVKFPGARAVDANPLDTAVQPLLNSDYDQTFVREFVRRNVGPLYASLGYLKASFAAPRAEVLAGSFQNLAVRILVEEGDQYSLRDIQWSGHQAIPSAELASHVHVMPDHPADTVQMQKDLEEIHELYAAKGYITARLTYKPSFDDAAKTVVFNIEVHEGDLYSMGKLEIAGIDPARAEALKKACELTPGQPYDRDYWSRFVSKSGRLLPKNRVGWKAGREEVIHHDTKTVDVTLTFLPNAGE